MSFSSCTCFCPKLTTNIRISQHIHIISGYRSKLDVMGIESADLERHLLRQNQPASLLFKSDILSILKLILFKSAKVCALAQTHALPISMHGNGSWFCCVRAYINADSHCARIVGERELAGGNRHLLYSAFSIPGTGDR